MRANKHAKKSWPPVEPGNSFILFLDDLSLDEFTVSEISIKINVRSNGEQGAYLPGCFFNIISS